MTFDNETVTIKYYAGMLYDTRSHCYTTHFKLAELIKKNINVFVINQKTQEEITALILWQIIYTVEKDLDFPLPLNILKEIIKNGNGSISDYLRKIAKGLRGDEFAISKK